MPVFSSTPPAGSGLQIPASSSARRREGRPSGCGVRPVALATAVISMPDFVPSRKELNIFGLIEARSSSLNFM